MSNALKFTPKGRVELSVDCLSIDHDTAQLRFCVTDTGIGIAPELAQRLFQPFTQGDDSMRRRYQGTGLGLSISRDLVQLMGGELGLDSTPGQGSRFSFTLRLKLDPTAAASPWSLPNSWRNSALLVLEQDDRRAAELQRLLRGFGFAVSRIGAGTDLVQAARDAARTNPVELLLANAHAATARLPELRALDADGLLRSERQLLYGDEELGAVLTFSEAMPVVLAALPASRVRLFDTLLAMLEGRPIRPVIAWGRWRRRSVRPCAESRCCWWRITPPTGNMPEDCWNTRRLRSPSQSMVGRRCNRSRSDVSMRS